MQRLTIIFFLLCAIAAIASATTLKPLCKDSQCRIACPFGFKVDKDGCALCACNKSPCKEGQIPLDKYFCGRGPTRKDCPSTHQCIIAPDDRYAVCCPRK
ncbi:hypothetical protein I4U23_024521 [Adineta vaga]|nr:hypothetical protein I4U23_024521 [Adineta vaga]